MPDFASNTTNIYSPLTTAEIEGGFSGCDGSDGLKMTSANFNAVLNWISTCVTTAKAGLAQEVLDRIAGDTLLSNAIAAEAAARAAADAVEQAARISGDAAANAARIAADAAHVAAFHSGDGGVPASFAPLHMAVADVSPNTGGAATVTLPAGPTASGYWEIQTWVSNDPGGFNSNITTGNIFLFGDGIAAGTGYGRGVPSATISIAKSGSGADGPATVSASGWWVDKS